VSSIQIPNLPAVIGLNGAELFEGVQAGTSVKISLDQIIAATRAGLPTTLPFSVSVGGTGLDTFTIGDIMYASATQTFSKLADVALGNAIISGGVGAIPSYGKIGLTTHVSGALPVANGGTNITSYTIGDLIYASTAGVLSKLADVATGNALISGGVGAIPSYGKIGLTTHVSGALPVANGGTNITLYTIGDLIYASTAGVLSKLADVATGNALISGGVGVAPSYGKIILSTAGSHVTGTLPVGNGGTGQASNLTQYGVVYGGTTTAMATSAAGTATQVLHGNAAGAPTFSAVSLTADVSGTLPVANGGTGAITLTGYVKGTGTAALTASATIPNTDISGLGTMSTQAASAVAITGGAINGTTVGATTASTGAFTTVTATTSVLSTGAGGIGYATGAGVAVTQLTSRTTTTPTTGAKTTGAVTLFTAVAVVNTYFSFTVPNTAIAITDTVVVTVRGATNTYVAFVSAIVAATSFQITMASVVGTASDTPIVNFTIIKGVSA